MTKVRWGLALAALAFVVPLAHAGPFTYNDFSSVAGLQLNGNAAQVGNVLRLTPSAPGQSGSAFTTSPESLGSLASFSTYFQFRLSNSRGIGDSDGPGADGIVFVVQTVSNNVGTGGGGIGYQGILNSVGVEFDTFDNGEISGNHVAINTNGNVNDPVAANEPIRFNNGQIWNAWVDYDGSTNLLEVRWSLSAVRPVLPGLSAVENLPSILGSNNAFLGFTAGTGAGYNDQDILDWEFRDSFNPIQGAPEPATLTMLGMGVSSLLGYGWRRKRAAQA